ncbi:MAG: hypothetical protein ACI86C_001879 [Candidatus Latescibacterota bacterium]|jgi:hypothetical protein
MWAIGNPNLLCIQVDDVAYANSQLSDVGNDPGWCKGTNASYAEECELSVADNYTAKYTVYTNPANEVLNIDTYALSIEMVRIFLRKEN